MEDITIEQRPTTVFFATHDFIVYKDHLNLVLSNCSGEEISSIRCPADYRHFECLDMSDVILFMFSGKSILMLDKFGNDPIYHVLDNKFGRCITPILPSQSPFGIIFGAQSKDQVHFINYDYIDGSRISQSASWKVAQINDVIVSKNLVYALLDNTLITCIKSDTCETLWTRFETGFINPKLIPHEGALLYACDGIIKRHTGKKVDIIKVPMLRIHSLQGIIRDEAYVLTEDGRHITCISLSSKTVKWNIKGSAPIEETLIIKGRSKSGLLDDIMLLRTGDNLAVINLSKGRSTHFLRVDRFHRLRETGDHILAHKRAGQTDLIPGSTL